MTPCVETTHARDPDGYGRCNVKRFGRHIAKTHVLAWVEHHGRLPGPGMQINHHCDNRACCNVEHLYEGTQRDNIRDTWSRGRAGNHSAMLRRAQTHCGKGHEFTPDNTYIKSNGTRSCRTCHRERELARYHKSKAMT